MRKSAAAPDAGRAEAPPIVHETLRLAGQPLDPATRGFMEPRFGHDFSSVRVHTGHRAAESARAVNALAYTVGRDVVFGAGQYSPQTPAGSRLLAHELAHTIQNPGGGQLQPFLEVGSVDDPAERAADRAAEAALGGGPVSLSPGGGSTLRRKARTCTAEQTERADQRIVKCGDADYRVTMTTAPGAPRPDTKTSVSAGWNKQDIRLDIKVCRNGTEVHVIPTIDLPRAVGQAIGNAVSGSDALSGAKLSPGFKITLEQNESYTLTLEPKVTVDKTGVTGGGVTGTVKTPNVSVEVDATYDAKSHAGFLTFKLSGGSSTKKVDCHKEGKAYLVFQCERITHKPGKEEVPLVKVAEDEVRYVFFDYAKPEIRRNFRLPGDIQSLYAQGYRVTSVDGFTSPEGPRLRETKGFEGNIALAQERASAAMTWLREVCPTCDFSGATPQGRSELPPKLGAATPEPKGPKMESAAVDEFLGTGAGQTPDALAPKDPAELEAFRKLPKSQQRDRVFELMRRAEIRFHRDRVVQEHQDAVAPRDDFNAEECPDDVIEAARASFGINITTGVRVPH